MAPMAVTPTALGAFARFSDDEVFTPCSPCTPWTPNRKAFARGVSEWSAVSTNADFFGSAGSRLTSKSGASETWTRQPTKTSVDANDAARHDVAEDVANCGAELDKSAIVAAVRDSVIESPFAVSLMDPSEPDQRLLEVSEAFQELTGYGRGELQGQSTRLLSESCRHETAPEVWCALRHSHKTGVPLMVSAVNRHKEGWLFWNNMYVHGLIVAKDLATGEPIWFLVAVHCGSDEALDEPQDGDAFSNLRRSCEELRSQICSKLAERASCGGSFPGARKEMEEEEACPDQAQKKRRTPSEDSGLVLQVPQWC